jgi:hypothetical protein
MADILFWLVLASVFLMMGVLTEHFAAALIVTSVGAVVNVLPLFWEGED